MGNFPGTPPIASAHGARIDELIWFIHGLMIVLFIGWLIYFTFVLVKFHRRRAAQASYQGARGKFTTYIEVGVALIEGVLLVALSIPIWAEAVERFPSEKDALVIEVVGRQFNWTARYPGADGKLGAKDVKFVTVADPFGTDRKSEGGADDFVVMSEFVVPVNKPIIAKVSSLDVIHSFTVRPMRIMQDAIPGMQVPLHFMPNKTGEFPITCAQLCGLGHYSMKGVLKVVTADAYQQWLKEKGATATPGLNSFE